MNAKERIEILRNGEVISEDVKQMVLAAADWLSKRQVNVDSDSCQMFITHLAMCLDRNDRGENVSALPKSMMDEVRSSEGYGLACEFVGYMENLLNKKLPESEKGYILLHVSNLKEKENKRD